MTLEERTAALAAALSEYQAAVSAAAAKYRAQRKQINGSGAVQKKTKALEEREQALRLQLIPFYEQLLRDPDKQHYRAETSEKLNRCREELIQARAVLGMEP